jgi:hypothetical protein
MQSSSYFVLEGFLVKGRLAVAAQQPHPDQLAQLADAEVL